MLECNFPVAKWLFSTATLEGLSHETRQGQRGRQGRRQEAQVIDASHLARPESGEASLIVARGGGEAGAPLRMGRCHTRVWFVGVFVCVCVCVPAPCVMHTRSFAQASLSVAR